MAQSVSQDGVSFSMLRIPVRVRWSFLVAGAVLGWAPGRIDRTLEWIAVMFVCVLVHELGHATVARRFGQRVHIELHAMGGTAHLLGGALATARSVAVLFAGPAFGFALGALVYPLTLDAFGDVVGASLPRLVLEAVHDVLWISWGYGVLNLLPITPLDGGQIAQLLLIRKLGGERGRRASEVLAWVVGAGLIVGALVFGSSRAAFVLVWLLLSRAAASGLFTRASTAPRSRG